MWISYLDMKKRGNISVAFLINYGHLKIINKTRNFVKMIGKVLLYTAVHDIAQRGDNEDEGSLNCGNFKELLYILKDFNDEFKSIRKSHYQTKYTSPQV